MKKNSVSLLLIPFLFLANPLFSQHHQLNDGDTISKKLLKGEDHVYDIRLENGGGADFVVMQKGVDLAIDVIDPSGKKIGHFDSPNGTDGPEPVTIGASKKGIYKAHIYPLLQQDGMADSELRKWPDINQGAYEIRDLHILSAKEYTARTKTEKVQEVATVNWITQNAHALKAVVPGSGFEDLQWLQPVLANVKYLGLGPSTVGTKEFFQMNERMFEFLVKEMGFTGFVLQESQQLCENINQYVLNGTGNISEITNLLDWGGPNLNELAQWMRNYNRTAPEDKKLQFFGLDPQGNGKSGGLSKLQDYYKKVDPQFAKGKDSLFIMTALFEDGDTGNNYRAKEYIHDWNAALVSLQTRKGEYIKLSSKEEYERTLNSARSVAQLNSFIGLSQDKSNSLWGQYTTSNFEDLVEEAKPGTKFVILGYGSEISKENEDFGARLKAAFGDRYYAMGFSFNNGKFSAKDYSDTIRWNRLPLKEFTAGSAKTKSLDWYLAQAQKDKFIINFRAADLPPAIQAFTQKKLDKRDFGMAEKDEWLKTSYLPVTIGNAFDGMIFIDNTSAVALTQNNPQHQ